MTFRLLTTVLALATLAGCGAVRPGAVPLKRPSGLAARGADSVKLPKLAPEVRLPLTEEGFARLRAAFKWEEQNPRTDYYYDAWDGRAFRRATDPQAARLRLKTRRDKAGWQISKVIERREVGRAGLPVQLTVARSWEDDLKPAEASHLLKRTREFFLWLDQGGEPLRQSGREIALAFQHLPWAGADIFFPAGSVAPALYPSAMKIRHGWTVKVPGEEVGGGQVLGLHFDEVRDAEGRWTDAFEIEGEPLDAIAPEGYEGVAVDFGRALAAVGLTEDDLGPEKTDATAFTAGQLKR